MENELHKQLPQELVNCDNKTIEISSNNIGW